MFAANDPPARIAQQRNVLAGYFGPLRVVKGAGLSNQARMSAPLVQLGEFLEALGRRRLVRSITAGQERPFCTSAYLSTDSATPLDV